MKLPTLDEVDAELARRSLASFVRRHWATLEPEKPLIWNWHIDAICEHLEAVSGGHIRRLVINIPPGCMKSMLVSVMWPAWVWATRPGWRVITASYAHKLAVRDAAKSRRVLESARYQLDYPGRVVFSDDQNAKDYYENTKGGVRQCISPGGGTTGFRGDAAVLDDPLNAMDAYSESARESVNLWLDAAVGSRLNDLRTDPIVLMMQRLHTNDPTGHLLEQGEWEHLCLPSEFDPKRRSTTCGGLWTDPRTEPGELLFPTLFPKEVLDRERKRMQSAYEGQHQQIPVSTEGGMFPRAWWRRYRALPKNSEEFGEWSLSVDCTFKGRTQGQQGKPPDYVAIGVWLKWQGKAYLVKAVNRRLNFPQTRAVLLRLCEEFPKLGAKYVELGANGQGIVDALQADNGVSGLIGVKLDGRSKEARAAAVTHWVEAGDVWLPAGQEFCAYPWEFDDAGDPVQQYVDQLATFPRGANDDQVDQTSQYLHRAFAQSQPVIGVKAIGVASDVDAPM